MRIIHYAAQCPASGPPPPAHSPPPHGRIEPRLSRVWSRRPSSPGSPPPRSAGALTTSTWPSSAAASVRKGAGGRPPRSARSRTSSGVCAWAGIAISPPPPVASPPPAAAVASVGSSGEALGSAIFRCHEFMELACRLGKDGRASPPVLCGRGRLPNSVDTEQHCQCPGGVCRRRPEDSPYVRALVRAFCSWI